MRKMYLIAVSAVITLSLTFIGCQKDVSGNADHQTSKASKSVGNPGAISSTTCASNAYSVSLLGGKPEREGCNYVWTWSVQNNNPGNGLDKTFQDMSHWGFLMNGCADGSSLNPAHIVSIQYKIGGSPAETTGWEALASAIGVDKSQDCQLNPVFKFDAGTSGNQITYFRLVLNSNYSVNTSASGFYKSGSRTGCCTFTFSGVGCQQSECLYSRGYWFSKKAVWGKSISFTNGDNSLTITEEQADMIWASRKGNIYKNNNSVAKKAFYQAAAIQLSLCDVNSLPANVLSAYNKINNFLAELTFNQVLTGTYHPSEYQDIMASVGVLSNHIQSFHCDDDVDVTDEEGEND